LVTRNPYHFGSPASSPYFCDREAEVADLEARMTDGIHVFLLGPRRYGKSSIVERAIGGFRSAGGRAGYADLIRCTTEAEVATEMLRAVVNGVLRAPKRAKEQLEGVLRRLRVTPTVSFESDGSVSFGVDPSVGSRAWQQILDDALTLLDEAGRDGPVALALDEFQRIAELGGKGMGGAFKAATDRLTHASLVLSGSHLSVMERLTRTRGAPLYGMGELMVIDVIAEDKMVPYLQRRARAGDKHLSKEAASYLYAQAGAVPNDVQWLAYSAFEAAGDADVIDNSIIDAGMAAVVGRQASNFAERFETLPPSQQRVLKILADSPTSHVYAKAFLDRAQVANANAVRKAIGVLAELELVRRRAGIYEVASPFLRAWLLRHSGI
jgi:uncharacterized protein